MPETIEKTHHFRVPADSVDQRLDLFLVQVLPDLSRARLKSIIDRGLARIDGCVAKAARKLKGGQEVTLAVPRVAATTLAPDPGVTFEIIYEDPHIVVINKPAGLVVHPAAGHFQGTLIHGLLAVCPDLAGVGGQARPGLVHRLDKDTSGVMVVAKTDQAHQRLSADFKKRWVNKTYLAICVGLPRMVSGEIDAPIGRHPIRRKQMSTRSTAGRPAVTRYEALRSFNLGAALLKVTILTGRTHQIRVHLASVGLPILGDQVYGQGPASLKKGELLKGLVNRPMLHAHVLGLRHPVSDKALEFTAPPPEDMVRVIEVLEEFHQAHE